MILNRLKTFTLTLAIFLINIMAFADSESQNTKTLSPYFFVENGNPSIDQLPLKSTNILVNISGVIAEVTVKQQYANNGTRPINAKYIFPASTRAAVHGMQMRIGDEIITAKIKERETAQKQFDQAKKEGKTASLLKQQRPNVFSMSLSNIMPGDIIDIELKYTELLVPTDMVYEFVYPTVTGPRYSGEPETSANENNSWIKNPYLKQGVKSESGFNIDVNIATGIPLQEVTCITHDIETIFETESKARLKLKSTDSSSGNRDYIVRYRLAGQKVQSGIILSKGQKENFFLLMLEPPNTVKPSDIPAREYIFVVDVSGSMNGFPLDTAKNLLNDLIGNLREEDSFNVVLFAGTSNTFSSVSVSANSSNIEKAIRFIEEARGSGGTELLSALKHGFSIPKGEDVSRTVMVITDGYIEAEKDVFEFISDNLNSTNVFAFGIGSSVNRYLIEGIAKSGLGEPFIVTTPYEARITAQKFREYVSSPVLTSVSVKFTGFDVYDVEPATIPDLFAQRPIIVTGKWRGESNGRIEVKGRTGKEAYSQIFKMDQNKSYDTESVLKYLWARKRISRLSDFNTDGEDSEIKSEITNLGLTYNLLTRHTSFIAVRDIVRNTEGPAKDVKQPLPLPKGVTNLAVGDCARVPEPGLYILVLLMTTVTVTGIFRRKMVKVLSRRRPRK
ncbi:MAG: VWA domain-containing protein [Deltaproteobacteria bacterium]|nr:VWA domain-containing protein [Deltaproteobacteria bacterium]